jgi:hypothetical protein
VPRTAQGASSDFLAGLVTIEKTMIALISLGELIPSQAAGEAQRTAA